MKKDSAGNKRKKAHPTDDAGSRPRRPGRPEKPVSGEQIEPGEIREVLDGLAAGVVKVSKEGRIVYANAYARQLFDMPNRDPVGLLMDAYEPYTIWEDGSPCGHENYPPTRCLRTGEQQSDVTIGLRVPGDRVRWVTVGAVPLLDPKTGEPDSVIVTVVDSSHPKHVEESLRESEERYRRLVERAPDAIVVHRYGTIAFINDAGVKLYGGRSREDFIGRHVLDFVHPNYHEKAKHRSRRTLENENVPSEVQHHLRLDGRPFHVEVTATPCIYRGQPSVQVICRDVTRRRRAERAVRRAKAELERRVQQRTEELSNKNAELQRKQRLMEQTLAVHERDRKLVAYEIHDTILQDVIGALLFLDAMNGDRGGADQENARRLERAGTLLRKCIGEARRMISGLRPLIIDEQGIVGGIEYLVSEINGRGLDIRFSHSMTSERLAADLESTVFRIVQEALTNLERHSQATRGEVKITQRGTALHVEVRDDGIGFDPDAVANGHYGLEGLKERARLAGGSACVESAVGKGTEIVVDLPLVNGGHDRVPADR